jgi:hypothetical protein
MFQGVGSYLVCVFACLVGVAYVWWHVLSAYEMLRQHALRPMLADSVPRCVM